MSEKKNRSRIGFFLRLKLAWYAFRLKGFSDDEYLPYQIISELQKRIHYDCDIEGCENCHKYCMSRGGIYLIVGVYKDEHLHVCEDHANRIKGKFEDYRDVLNDQKE